MTEVSAQEVAALRKRTGAGMMDSKKALMETGGDLDAAADWLREHNLAGAGKRAGRSADQGAVAVVVDERAAVVVELTAETDFVAKGKDFQKLLSEIAARALADGVDDLESKPLEDTTVGAAVQQLSGTLGEKIELGRVARFETNDGILDGYRHVQAERGVIGVLVELAGVERTDEAIDVAHDVALHVANSSPAYTTRDDVPDDVIAREREVLENLTRNEGKPEQAIAKIVDGRLGGFYKERVLLDQPFVKDPKSSVGDVVAGLGDGAIVRRFVRVKVGEAEGE